MARPVPASIRLGDALALVCLAIVPAFLAACTLSPAREPAPLGGVYTQADAENHVRKSWWACRFFVHWPMNEAPDFAVDLLLAHSVVAPALKTQTHNIDWWRFHRRAARDAAGHRFRFLFYAEPQVAAEVFEAIVQNRVLQQALAAKLVDAVHCDDPATPRNRDPAALSDPNWSAVMQRNWPYFIMGVSSLWLAMIDDLAGEMVEPSEPMDLPVRMEAYRRTESELNALWRDEGQHALLHHLNAMFGYEPIRIRKNLRF